MGATMVNTSKLFLENVKKPVITTLHTVQPNFDQKAIEVLKYIVERSEAIIVIAHAAIDMLKQQGISSKKCVVIPHGCPSVNCTNKQINQGITGSERPSGCFHLWANKQRQRNRIRYSSSSRGN